MLSPAVLAFDGIFPQNSSTASSPNTLRLFLSSLLSLRFEKPRPNRMIKSLFSVLVFFSLTLDILEEGDESDRDGKSPKRKIPKKKVS